jgi:hypothetical protein
MRWDSPSEKKRKVFVTRETGMRIAQWEEIAQGDVPSWFLAPGVSSI